MRKRSELLFSAILVPIDFLALLSAFVLAYVIRVKLEGRPVAHVISATEFLQVILILVPVWIVIFALTGLYAQSNLRGRWGEMGKIFLAVSGGVMFTILIDFLQPQSLFPSKSVPVYAYGLGLVMVASARLVVRMIQRWLFQFGIGVQNALIIGSGELAAHIRADLASSASGIRILACVDAAKGVEKRMSGMPVFQDFDAAITTLGAISLDQIIQADSNLNQERILDMVRYATNHHISYRFIPNQFGLYAANAAVGNLAGVTMVELRLTPLEGWGRVAKRIFDVIGSSLALVMLAPVLIAVAAMIKLKDPSGPLIFRHRRLSRDGAEIYLYKFRTMIWKYCDGPDRPFKSAEDTFRAMGRPELIEEFRRVQKVGDDPRVSRFGRILRRTSLDELPQLVNVFKGDLSLVGPRPIIPSELEHYGNRSASFLALKPGCTGLWVISGRNDVSYEERVKLDIYYVENWSLLLDLRILLKTVGAIIGRQGAY
jgi:exopolysaccharide biosynthesis polyprenyl glycosylphosphotransferase